MTKFRSLLEDKSGLRDCAILRYLNVQCFTEDETI